MRTDEGVCPYFVVLSSYAKSTIPDPYYGGAEDFELALDLIEDGCEGLI
ncbi:hypothetical protein [Prevotella veroralis]|uniref:Protein-tyrosine-phosphatase n=1 Tax=Prevotella veroralis F0319 TaxID=649761 RepID=C9MLL7_9BACT|nr:hypothetical protein HMPREF0973_00492 [Prevotella veroralis F0319]